MTMTAMELLGKAAECIRCHQVHQERLAPAHPVRGDMVLTTAAEDGHPYSPLLDERTIERLRELIAADAAAAHAEPEPGPCLIVELAEDGTVTVANWSFPKSGDGLTVDARAWADFVASVKAGGYDDMVTDLSSAEVAAIGAASEPEAVADSDAAPADRPVAAVPGPEPVKPAARTRAPRTKAAATATAK